MTNNQVQIEDWLRHAGYTQWEHFPEVWKLPNGEGAYITEEALFLDWRNALTRAGRAEERAESAHSSLVTMAICSAALFVTLLVLLLVFHA